MTPNPENSKMNEATQDVNPSERAGESGFGVEVVNSQGNTVVVEKLQQLESALSHDTPLTAQQVLETEKSLDSIKVIVGGEEMTVAEMKKIPDLKMNMKIWEEIENGDINSQNTHNLTYITVHIAKIFSTYQGPLFLNGLTSISDVVAGYLADHQGQLHLSGLSSISDVTAKFLSQHYLDVFLDGLTFLSDAAAEYLSSSRYGIRVDGLTSISDSVAERLSKCKSFMHLHGLSYISDTAARHLSQIEGKIYTSNYIEQRIDSFKTPKP